MRSVRWLVAALLISGCRPYGSIASLATPDVRTSAVEFAGRWRAPDPMRCRATGAGGGSRWSTSAVFEVRGDSSTFCENFRSILILENGKSFR
jgi:hypothetical protein